MNRMYKSHQECSPRIACILITTLQLWDALDLFTGLFLNFSICANEITKINQNY